ncbi:hypothetical protein A2U01_0064579, partial [Trifolium medium]|nr:hypothetical protein [Trifolium medium]
MVKKTEQEALELLQFSPGAKTTVCRILQ